MQHLRKSMKTHGGTLKLVGGSGLGFHDLTMFVQIWVNHFVKNLPISQEIPESLSQAIVYLSPEVVVRCSRWGCSFASNIDGSTKTVEVA